VSMNYAYPELNIPALLNARGKQLFEQVRTECTVEAIAAHAFTQSATLTTDGRSLTAYLGEEPYRSRVAEQKIGTLKPTAPVLIVHSALDDIVPYAQDRDLGRTWCGKGVRVQFSTTLVPTHVLGAVRAYP
jgi:Secretory lipase